MLSSLVTFTGESADTKVVLLLHKEKKKKINKQSCEASCYGNGSQKFTNLSFRSDCYHTKVN